VAVPVPAVDLVSQPRVGWRFLVPYVVAMVAMWMCFNAPSQVLIGQQLIVLDEANKERNLAIVLSVGAVISLVANPVFGMLSDRSRSIRGRRRPFLLGGAIGTCLGLALLAVAPNVAVLLLGWSLVQGSLNCYLAAIIAIIPDRVPAAQRALVSGLAGLSQVIGTVAGVGLTNVMPTTVAKYALLGAVLGLAVLGLYLAYHDRPWTGGRPAWPTLAEFFGSLGHRDFALAWLTRGLVTLGLTSGPLEDDAADLMIATARASSTDTLRHAAVFALGMTDHERLRVLAAEDPALARSVGWWRSLGPAIHDEDVLVPA